MKSIVSLVPLFLLAFIFANLAQAHPGGHAHEVSDTTATSRTWTLSESGAPIHGTFVLAANGDVRIQREDGKVVKLPTRSLIATDRVWIENRLAEIKRLNNTATLKLAQAPAKPRDPEPADRPKPVLHRYFTPFSKSLKLRWDDRYYYVESNGMPAHPMMKGITAWQQQVPLPQPYTGSNAWRIPLRPVPAKNPMSAKTHFFRGAIALAVNGVPVFNPIKNDGRTDTFKAGELDQWGGHCGRADDYHYHIAPVHLEKVVGAGKPVAVALDGYLIYGYNDPDGKPPKNLDWLNGHKGPEGVYHYHATKTYPYLNGGFYGEVVERDGQVDPQPRAQGVRPALRGLRGAKITGYETPKPGSHVVRYEVFGEKRSVEYTVAGDGSAVFTFVSPQGAKTEKYSPRERNGDARGNAAPPRGDGPSDRGRGGDSGRRPGRDPIIESLDTNADGQIDKAELRKIVTALQQLDKNNDGKVTIEEIRGKRPARAGETGGRVGPRGPQPGDGPRQPWILVHADEIDLDKNKIISRDEIVGEATRAFAGYDANNDGNLTQIELSGRGAVRSAMGGFLKGHSREIDRDGDGVLTRKEATSNAERMFSKIDRNNDGKITPEEMEAARRK